MEMSACIIDATFLHHDILRVQMNAKFWEKLYYTWLGAIKIYDRVICNVLVNFLIGRVHYGIRITIQVATHRIDQSTITNT